MSGYLLPNGQQIDLGTRVRFEAVLARRSSYPSRDYETGRRAEWTKTWERVGLGGFSVVKEGIVVGVRTLQNGVNEGGGWDEPIYFRPTERFRAVLISTDLRSRPVFARFEDVEVLPPTDDEWGALAALGRWADECKPPDDRFLRGTIARLRARWGAR
jgi:hypothetical protein